MPVVSGLFRDDAVGARSTLEEEMDGSTVTATNDAVPPMLWVAFDSAATVGPTMLPAGIVEPRRPPPRLATARGEGGRRVSSLAT